MIPWRSVACEVNLTSQELDDIASEVETLQQPSRSFLMIWIERYGSAATYTKLCEALIECNFGRHVEKILAIAKIRYVCCSVLDFM